LSHLAILAREYNKTIIKIDNKKQKILKKGKIKINYENESAEIEIN